MNASGQFCGVAEMVGRVDFNKNMDFWQQDKWTGSFPVKWHIIKDVPNPQLRHIILENNDNKPVTNSRDTQEVCMTLLSIALFLLILCVIHETDISSLRWDFLKVLKCWTSLKTLCRRHPYWMTLIFTKAGRR